MRIHCVVVTYNHLHLLQSCLQAIQAQSRPVDGLWVIDNHSTDGTAQWLDETAKAVPSLHVVHTGSNTGGAGGFSLGTRLAVEAGCDYVWLMDDDTHPAPDALQHLARAAAPDGSTGFACSKVEWTDGTPHVMNRPALEAGADKAAHTESINGEECVACKTCSFVSVLVGSKAVREVGLPIKEFFIWCDDIEFTLRIHDAGYACHYVPASRVTHATRLNYFPSIDIAPPEMAARFYYQARNTCYMKRRATNRVAFYVSVFNKWRVYMPRLTRRTDRTNISEFRRAVTRGCIDGLTFNPTIEHINDTSHE